MFDCCCPNTIPNTKQICPECGFTCKSVGMVTLYHQVRFPENQELISDSYFFCPTKTCPLAYFSSHGNTVPKQHLRAYQAMQSDMLCYCFDINADQYLSALKGKSGDSVKNFVVQ